MTDSGLGLDAEALADPAAGVEHCGKPMRWQGASIAWEGEPGQGVEQVTSDWVCDCGATLRAVVRIPA